MSMLDANFKSSASSILVEKILEQGQRLRNSMVQAILNNDPFNQEILHNTNITTNAINERKISKSLKCTCKTKKPDFDICDGIDKYLRQDNFFLNQELEALETNRSTSPVDFLRSASSVNNACHCKNVCGICREYETKLISHSASASICSNGDSSIVVTTRQQSIQSKEPPKLNTEKTLKSCDEIAKLKPRKTKSEELKIYDANSYLTKYVDSLKINIYSLKLNNAGQRKLLAYTGTGKYPVTPFTYFIEYSLPEFLTKNIQKIKSRVNSGLNTEKKVRYCAKNVEYDLVYFKQQKIHSVTNIHMLDLNSVNINFCVSFRSAKQRLALKIGKASFNLGSLVANRYLSCEQELVLMNENAPVALGAIKISVQLGCDKLYFGKEFIDAISCSKENTNLSENDSIHKEPNAPLTNRNRPKSETHNVSLFDVYTQEQQQVAQLQLTESKIVQENKIEINSNEEIDLLYALIFISEVQFTSTRIDSFIICRGFSREDTVTSRTILNECNPNFNLYQIIPILLDENYVNRFRDNYILVEVWEQSGRDQLLGICKLPVHQFYVAYRNSLIVKYLTRSPHPVISVDWWEPIINPTTNLEVGQLRSIVALGTQSQILNLEQNRNIKDCLIKNPKYSESTDTDKCLNNTPYTTARESPKTLSVSTVRIEDTQQQTENLDSNIKSGSCNEYVVPELETEPKSDPKQKPEIIQLFHENSKNSSSKVDASTQFESKMDSSETNIKSTPDNTQQHQRDLLNTFLEQLISVRDMPQRNQQTETSTNTDECITNVKNSSAQDFETLTSSGCLNDDQQQQQLTMDNISMSNETFPIESNSNVNSNANVRHTSDLLDSLQKALTLGSKNEINQNETDTNTNTISDKFKVHILIESALHLPSRKKCKSKRSKTKSSKQNEEILPSTYVTFKGVSDNINITQVVPKSTSPKWDFRSDIYLPTELLLNNQKRLIFKVWRKANGPNLQPNFQTDIVLGFAALDLTVLISGLPNVQGWFNIVDFTSKCNGQIKIHVNPLENLSKFVMYKRSFTPEKLKTDTTTVSRAQLSLKCPTTEQQLDKTDKTDKADVPDDLIPSDSLSRALKRKFTELDEITQRLRQRLCAVTNDDFDETNDLFEDEFERDLNTLCDDDDFVIEDEPMQKNNRTVVDMENQPSCSSYHHQVETARSTTTSIMSAINAANEISLHCYDDDVDDNGSSISLQSSNKEQAQVTDKLDNHLNEGKLKIDALLEKLTLLTNDTSEPHNKTNLSFTSRYVSGCSDSNPSVVVNTNQKQTDVVFNPHLFQEIFASNHSLDETRTVQQYSSLNNLVNDIPSSENSSNVDLQSVSSSSTNTNTNTNTSRQAPDGAGHMSNESRA